MNNSAIYALIALVVVAVGGAIVYQKQKADADAAAYARTPGAQICAGIGSLVGGIASLATGGGSGN